MSLTKVFTELKAARDAGVMGNYAVGGAIAATVYLEPAATEDVDIFVTLTATAGSLLVTLDPLYSFFQARGASVDGERLAIGGWLVQLLTPPSPLVEDALANAFELDVDGAQVPVFTQEHLAAIAVEAGRLKDKMRVRQFLASPTLDHASFTALIERFGLTGKFDAVQAFLRENA